MDKKDFNAPTLENIMRIVKKLEARIPWINCKGCDKRMQDLGFEKCYDCKDGGAPKMDTPAPNKELDQLMDF
jgi:hypothetical protein